MTWTKICRGRGRGRVTLRDREEENLVSNGRNIMPQEDFDSDDSDVESLESDLWSIVAQRYTSEVGSETGSSILPFDTAESGSDNWSTITQASYSDSGSEAASFLPKSDATGSDNWSTATTIHSTTSESGGDAESSSTLSDASGSGDDEDTSSTATYRVPEYKMGVESESISDLTSSTDCSEVDYDSTSVSFSADESGNYNSEDVSSSSEDDSLEYDMHPDSDFLLPEKVKIPSKGDALKEDSVALCYAGQVVSPSEFYLALSRNFPEDMDTFIAVMSDEYSSWSGMHRKQMWMMSGKHRFLKPGSIVACFNTDLSARQQSEMVRGKIIRDVSTDSEKKFDVFLIDIGKYVEGVHIYDMFFLHQEFASPPTWAIKCRLHLDPYYDDYHKGELQWPRVTTDVLSEVLKGGRLEVRFVRQVIQEHGEKIWEVSIQEVEKTHRYIRKGKLVEDEIIKRTMPSSVC